MPILTQLYWLFILSLIVASIAWTVTQEEIFSEWREFCNDRRENCETTLKQKFYYVFTCEYCFSHWVTLIFIILTGFQLLIYDWRGYVLAFFAIPWLANQWMSLYRRLRLDIKHEDAVAEEAQERVKKKTQAETRH